MTAATDKQVSNMEFAIDKLECYYRLLEIIKDMPADEEDIKIKLMKAIVKR